LIVEETDSVMEILTSLLQQSKAFLPLQAALAGRIEKLEAAYEQLGLIIERARDSHDEG